MLKDKDKEIAGYHEINKKEKDIVTAKEKEIT